MAAAISTPMLSRRALVFIGIVLLHLGFIYALNAGLVHQAAEMVYGPIETKMIEDIQDQDEEPPPPPPKIETAPPPFVPPPDIAIDLPVEISTTTTAITATTQKPVVQPPPPPPPAAVVRVQPSVDPRRPMPISDDDYPPQSARLGEEGQTRVRLWVLENGSIGDVQIVKSSGYERLDNVALRKLRRWRIKPGTEDGKPVAMWFELNVTWKIPKR